MRGAPMHHIPHIPKSNCHLLCRKIIIFLRAIMFLLRIYSTWCGKSLVAQPKSHLNFSSTVSRFAKISMHNLFSMRKLFANSVHTQRIESSVETTHNEVAMPFYFRRNYCLRGQKGGKFPFFTFSRAPPTMEYKRNCVVL